MLSEIFLIFTSSFILGIGVYYSKINNSLFTFLRLQYRRIVLFIFIFLFFIYYNSCNFVYLLFVSQAIKDNLSFYLVLLLLLGSFFFVYMSGSYLYYNNGYEFEFFIILLLIILGSSTIIFSNDLLLVYLGVELQSLSLYILAGYKTNSVYSTEAGLKYFILGAFASSLLLLSFCFLYGMTGLSNIQDIMLFMSITSEINSFFFLVAFFFLFISLIFKIGGAPLHIWVPDVYEGAGTIVTALFSLIPKIGIISLFLKFLFFFFSIHFIELFFLLGYSGVLSVLIGTVGALGQISVKRLLSYSAVTHSGFLLFGLSSFTFESLYAVSFYIFVYMLLISNIFSILLQYFEKGSLLTVKLIGNLRYIYFENKLNAIIFMLAIFSLAGVPPLSGFFSKFFVFFSCIKEGYVVLSLLLILLSVIGTAYYLKIVRESMFFVLYIKKGVFITGNSSSSIIYLSVLLCFLNLTFFLVGGPFLYLLSNLLLFYIY